MADGQEGGHRLPSIRLNIRKAAAIALASAGFFSSNFINVMFTSRTNNERQQLMTTIREIEGFISQSSGLRTEVATALGDDRKANIRSMPRFFHNLVFLSRIQQRHIGNGMKRRDACKVVRLRRRNRMMPSDADALRYMKFATAAYGRDMIRASHIRHGPTIDNNKTISRPNPGRLFFRRRPYSIHEDIGNHIGIPPKDIVASNVSRGGSVDMLRYFLAIDHERKALVLSIRGTFSISDVVTSIAGYSSKFCGGEAHTKIAEMAMTLWSNIGELITTTLNDLPRDYKLILTGHSLGAGTACLLTIYLLYNNNNSSSNDDDASKSTLGRKRRIRCMAYACPPVFYPWHAVPRAVQRTTNYIYQDDAIPFLSLDSIRRSLACVNAIETHRKNVHSQRRNSQNETRDEDEGSKRTRIVPPLRWIKSPPKLFRPRFVMESICDDETLIQQIQEKMTSNPVELAGAPMLVVPAMTSVWIRSPNRTNRDKMDSSVETEVMEKKLVVDGEEKYDRKMCDVVKLAHCGILWHPSMLLHHSPTNYEYALGNLLPTTRTTESVGKISK